MAEKRLQVRKEQKEQERWLLPRASVREAEDGKIVLRIEMPGVPKEGLDIQVESNELRITGKNQEKRNEGEYLIRERRDGSYYRAYTLDDTIDPEKIEAKMESGVLTVTLQRKESEKPRSIAVKAE